MSNNFMTPKVIKYYNEIKLENGNYKLVGYLDRKKTIIDFIQYYDSNNKMHNDNGISYISYFKNGNINCINYECCGKFYRLDGPAVITYYESGEIDCEKYYINDIGYFKEEYYKQPEVIKFININRNLKLLNKK